VTVDLVAMAAPAAAGKPASLPKPVRPNPLPPTPAAAKPEPVPPAPKAAEVPKPAPPKPEPPKPEPPKPPPPPPPKNETVIPKTPEKEPEKPKEKPEPKAKPEPKPPPKEVAKAEPPPPAPAKPPPPKPQESYDDVLAGLRAERGESRPDRVERPTTANAATPGAGGTATAPGVRASGSASVTPEVAAWLRAARLHVRQAWVLPAGLRRELLETQIEVELDAQGNVLSEPKLVRRSGNPWYDESVVRAVQKASPLPPPPEAGTWPFVFKPEDLG
jgi:TonB family protein